MKEPRRASLAGRPYKRIWFECCARYARLYRNRRGDAYEGRCPGCHRPLRLRIGPGGLEGDSFRAR